MRMKVCPKAHGNLRTVSWGTSWGKPGDCSTPDWLARSLRDWLARSFRDGMAPSVVLMDLGNCDGGNSRH